MREYRTRLSHDDNGTVLVTCPRPPIVATFGETEAEGPPSRGRRDRDRACQHDRRWRTFRGPRADKGVAVLPATTVLKLQLYWALRHAGITRAELARRLAWNRESVDRLFRLDRRSRLEKIEAAFAALGRKVDISIRDAA
jgi:antitoxin HicB